MTITEALAEIKTVDKRIEKKRQFVKQYLGRQGHLKDPLEKDGGSRALIAQERQAIGDLEERRVALRRAIAAANTKTIVEIQGTTKSVADWIVWRREIAPGTSRFLAELSGTVRAFRDQVTKAGAAVVNGEPNSPQEVTINIDERQLAKDFEQVEVVLGELDGVLSLKNATVNVEI